MQQGNWKQRAAGALITALLALGVLPVAADNMPPTLNHRWLQDLRDGKMWTSEINGRA
jgi:hypothetical protein